MVVIGAVDVKYVDVLTSVVSVVYVDVLTSVVYVDVLASVEVSVVMQAFVEVFSLAVDNAARKINYILIKFVTPFDTQLKYN